MKLEALRLRECAATCGVTAGHCAFMMYIQHRFVTNKVSLKSQCVVQAECTFHP
jgi:hypothetical protein